MYRKRRCFFSSSEASYKGTVDFHVIHLFLYFLVLLADGRSHNPSAPWTRHSPASPVIVSVCHFLVLHMQTHAAAVTVPYLYTRKRRRRRASISENIDIYVISQSITASLSSSQLSPEGLHNPWTPSYIIDI